MRLIKQNMVTGLLLLLVLSLSACIAAPSSSDEAAATESQEQAAETTLNVALPNDINTLYVPETNNRIVRNALQQMYNSLVWLNNDGDLVPALAESWEVSEDGTEYTFMLRQGVTFHNGEPFNAEAVVFSWENALEAYRGNKWDDAQSVEAIDEFTVKMTTEKPDPIFLRQMADEWAMIPPVYFAEVGAEGFAENPVGTGAFRFVEWVKGDSLVLEANPDYWETDLSLADNLVFRIVTESATRVAGIQTGQLDIVSRLSAAEADSLRGVDGIEIVEYAVDRVFYIGFNNRTTGVGTPIENQLVRQAMNYAVDRQAIVDAIFDGKARLSASLIGPSNLGFDESLTPYPYDPAKATELLAEAGYADGFTIDYVCPTDAYDSFDQVCEAIQSYLAEVGIDAQLELIPSSEHWGLGKQLQYAPLFGDGWSAAAGEAFARVDGTLSSRDTYSVWADEDIYALVDEIFTTVDDVKRAELYGQLAQQTHDDPPFIYLYEPIAFEATQGNIQGYSPRASEQFYLKDVVIGSGE
ncbi:MAG: ABC transporter substrate-binding protein [Chloroflexota bacterium]